MAVPADLSLLHGPTSGRVQLPLRVHSSGAGPAEIFDLAEPADLAQLYAIVLEHGSVDDVTSWLDATTLRRLWPTVWLPPHVRRAWAWQLHAHTEG